jgi:hypothetical protein
MLDSLVIPGLALGKGNWDHRYPLSRPAARGTERAMLQGETPLISTERAPKVLVWILMLENVEVQRARTCLYDACRIAIRGRRFRIP